MRPGLQHTLFFAKQRTGTVTASVDIYFSEKSERTEKNENEMAICGGCPGERQSEDIPERGHTRARPCCQYMKNNKYISSVGTIPFAPILNHRLGLAPTN
jgi:hypothetical protein